MKDDFFQQRNLDVVHLRLGKSSTARGMYIQNHSMKPASTTKLFYTAYTTTVDHSGYCYCYRSITVVHGGLT